MVAAGMVQRKWSDLGRLALIWSIIMTFALSIVDAIIHAPAIVGPLTESTLGWRILTTDLRYTFEQGIYASIILLVGAKFFETRTVITIAFDKLDAKRMRLKAPDEQNIVWIGRQYGSTIEAEAVHAALEARLRESAE